MSQAPHLTLRNVTPAARSRRHVWSLLRGEVAAARKRRVAAAHG
ncbi:hypothetical protein ABZW11_28315 [Nonomuraea sp. NPDC004580]